MKSALKTTLSWTPVLKKKGIDSLWQDNMQKQQLMPFQSKNDHFFALFCHRSSGLKKAL